MPGMWHRLASYVGNSSDLSAVKPGSYLCTLPTTPISSYRQPVLTVEWKCWRMSRLGHRPAT